MQEEFKKLLEAMALGELDEPGRERLRQIASSDSALAARLKRELAVEAMLTGLGPNHAPRGLTAKVFARLDADQPSLVTDVSRAIRRAGSGRGTGFPWVPMTYLRWASAVVVLGVVVFEAGLLVKQRRQSWPGSDSVRERTVAMDFNGGAHTTSASQVFYEDISNAGGGAAEAEPALMADAPSVLGGIEVPSTAQAPEQMLAMEVDQTPMAKALAPESPAAFGLAARALAPETPGEEGAMVDEVVSTEKTDSEELAVTQKEMMVASATPKPAAKPAPKLETAPMRVLERRVAFRMPLASAPEKANGRRTKTDLEGLVKGLTGEAPPAPVKRTLVNGDHYRTRSEGSVGKGVSLRDVEMAIAVAGGDIVSRERVADSQDAWKVTARMTPTALRKFLEKYSAPVAGEVVETDKPSEIKSKSKVFLGDRAFNYPVLEGRNLLWALGFEAASTAKEPKASREAQPEMPRSERPQPHPERKIDVILYLESPKSPDRGDR